MKLVGLFVAMMVAVVCGETALDQFASGNLKFTARLYNEILKENPSKNFIFSPFSVEVILALTRAGAKGQTASEFTSALNLPSESATEDALKKFLPQLKQSHDSLKLLSANRLFLGQSFKFLEAFQQLATGTFDAGLQNVDFSQSAEAAGIINQWVEQQTNNRIKNLIQPDAVDAATRLVLVNALYFSGKWSTPFLERTRQEPFFVTKSETKLVDMMFVEDTFRYYESQQLNAQFLELPYLGDNITMTIVLPREKDGLSAIESNLEAALAPQNLQYQRVSVKLPSFVVESDIKLKPILQKLGLTTVFNDGADLSGISKEALKIDDVIQKAFINVTTGGTEAAAATAVHFVLYSLDVHAAPKPFSADHPFFYYIKVGDVIIFAGKILDF